MKFTLTIELGNAAMELPEHVAQALREVADKVERSYGKLVPACGSYIRDENGNTVGKWAVE